MLGALPPLAIGWLSFVALQRVVELVLSRANLAATPGARTAPRAGDRTEWSLLVAVHVLAIVAPAVEIAWTGRTAPRVLAWSMLALFAAAQALRAWTILTLGRAWNARAVVASSNTIATSGPFRWIRHPNYLAVLVELTAVPLGLGAWWSCAIVHALHAPLLARRIRAEEALLGARPEWRAAFGAKPRFVPRLRSAMRGSASSI